MKSITVSFFLLGVVTNGIQVARDLCSQAVSIDKEIYNDYCMALCEELNDGNDVTPLTNEVFTKKCTIAHYKIQNGRVSTDEVCFNNLIYGYSERTPDLDSLIPDLYYATPALCQLACQENPECVQWSWASTLVAKPDERHRCLLKSQDMVHGALAQKTSNITSEVDPTYCNLGMPVMCSSNAYKCLTCSSSKRCAWESDLHISGWRSCANEVDQCDATVAQPTEEGPTRYPICDEYVSINPTLTNDYCMDSCNELMAKNVGREALISNDDFKADCTHEHFHSTDGKARPSGKCFNNLVIGYSQESSLASVESAQGLYVNTPAQCQMHCQHHPDCKSFVFVTELIASTGSHDVHKCLLKSDKMVKEALSINLAATNVTVPPQYCNVNMPYMCGMGGYDCLSCVDGEKSCAWNSIYHIAGSQHCASNLDVCADHSA